jgi:hypothetical protein
MLPKGKANLHPTLLSTQHSEQRQAERGITDTEIEYVMQYGTRLWRAGVLHVFLRRRDIPKPDRRRYDRLEGIVILLDSKGGTIITTYHGCRRTGLKAIRCKPKFGRRQPLL